MCFQFRPHRGTINDSSDQTGTCPSCGMPVQTQAGVMPSECPHCGQPIPPDPASDTGTVPGTDTQLF